ncbi:MAG TPA: efflux RND transporter periplasmic adaptor subunit [Terracidiphilus sp.]|nr:efflux RND transporter periplasmic adaptor subunit [Terracidiphilus sp.]
MLLALPLLVCGSGCDSHPVAQAASTSPNEGASTSPEAASAVPATQTALDSKSFTTTGPLVAEQQADIAAERDGRVVQIGVQIGDRVQKGQLLAQLDDRALKSQCDAQKARIASAQEEVREWESEQKAEEADLHRADQMRTEQIISEENWEHVKFKLDETIAEVAHYRDEADASEAALSAANLQLEQSRIVAPFSGVVGRSSVRMAQQVKSGDVLFWITAEAPLHVLFTVPESAMADFSVGRALDLSTADYPGLHQPARIARVSPVVDPASGSVQVVGAVAKPSHLLKPGMSMQVRLAP